MRINECYINNFGKLTDFKISFNDGLNTIKAENGYGKTTLSVFIKAMFYGLDSTKRTKLSENDRKHYLPWNGLSAGGSLSFTTGGKEYRIERRFMPKSQDDTFKLYDVTIGKESTDFTENIGEELFGIDADGFERTIFLSEQNLSGKNENKTVSAKLSDLVGYECDLSVMDDALSLLEKERKVYYKRGGSGEIGELKEKINSLKIRLGELKRTGVSLEEEKASYLTIKNELKSLLEEREKLKKAEAENNRMRERFSYEKQYLDMQNNLEKEKDLKLKEELFFKNGVPKRELLQEFKEKLSESKMLEEASGKEVFSEYDRLADFFKNAPSDEEFERIKKRADIEKEKRKEAEIITAQIHPSSKFKNIAEAKTEIEALTEELKTLDTKKGRNLWKPAIACGILALLSGIGLAFLWLPLLSLSALGIAFIIASYFNFKSCKQNAKKLNGADRVKEILENKYLLRGVNKENLLDKLYSLKAEILIEEKNEKKRCELIEKANALIIESDSCKEDVNMFIERFEGLKECDTGAALDEIFKKRGEFALIKKSREERIAENEKRNALSLAYKTEANEFLSRYPTATEKPFDEISEHLIEYNMRSISISRLENDISEFIKKHGINPENLLCERPSILEEGSFDAINKKITELEREAALSERSIASMSEELEAASEYEAEIDELTEKKNLYENKLSVIVKTKEYLTEAKDSLTSKYLSGTKRAFDSYVNLISAEEGESFSMDTSFEIMKNESGSYKPMAAYSRGYQDLYAIAARLAIIDSLYDKELPFIILDDPFAYFDKEKLSKALSLIKTISLSKQIVYLTCSEERCI